MQAIRKLDDYLIGSDEGTIGDRITLYGFYAATLAVTVFTIVSL